MCHRNSSLWLHTGDTLITFSFSSMSVVIFFFLSDHCVRACVCVKGAARLKRKPRGAWFIYKAIAPMQEKKKKAQSAVGIVKSLPFKGNEINSLFNAPQDLLKRALLIIDA